MFTTRKMMMYRHHRELKRRGFTLLELLLSVVILAIITSLAFLTVSTVTMAWRKGTALQEDLDHGDYVIEQLVLGLRSTYYPENTKSPDYGFWFENEGDDFEASDQISWVKIGNALVGEDAKYSETPHRVKFYLDSDEDGDSVVAIKSWQLWGQMDDFDPEEVEPVFLSKRVQGFNFRPAYPQSLEKDELDPDKEIEWLDEWEETNKIPPVVEITLFLTPLDDESDPVEIKRIVTIPVAQLSKPWKTK